MDDGIDQYLGIGESEDYRRFSNSMEKFYPIFRSAKKGDVAATAVSV